MWTCTWRTAKVKTPAKVPYPIFLSVSERCVGTEQFVKVRDQLHSFMAAKSNPHFGNALLDELELVQ